MILLKNWKSYSGFFLSRFPSASNSRKLPASFQRLQTEVSTAHYMELAEFSGRGLLFLNDHRVLLDLFCSCTRLSCLFLNMSQGFGYVDVKQPSFEKQKSDCRRFGGWKTSLPEGESALSDLVKFPDVSRLAVLPASSRCRYQLRPHLLLSLCDGFCLLIDVVDQDSDLPHHISVSSSGAFGVPHAP